MAGAQQELLKNTLKKIYEPNEAIPSKKQTEAGQNVLLNNFIPFVHMFDKMEGQNFRILYEKIMRNNYD